MERLATMERFTSGGLTATRDEPLADFIQRMWDDYNIPVLEKVNAGLAVVALDGEIIHLTTPLGKSVSVSEGQEVFVLSIIAGG